MKRRAIFLFAILVLGTFFAAASYALPVDLVTDQYRHPLDTESSQQGVDVIGNSPPFQIFGHRWFSPGVLEIWTDWDNGLDGTDILDTKLGDVFLLDHNLAVAVRDHNLNRGTAVEIGDGISQGNVFNVETTRLSNQYYSDISTSRYGDNEIVTADGDVSTDVRASVSYAESSIGSGEYIISLSFLDAYGAYEGFFDSAIRFAYTCANDVHAPVPEPATMLLTGFGLLGMGTYFRRRLKKKSRSC